MVKIGVSSGVAAVVMHGGELCRHLGQSQGHVVDDVWGGGAAVQVGCYGAQSRRVSCAFLSQCVAEGTVSDEAVTPVTIFFSSVKRGRKKMEISTVREGKIKKRVKNKSLNRNYCLLRSVHQIWNLEGQLREHFWFKILHRSLQCI